MTISAEQAARLLEGTTPGPWYRDAWDIRAPSPGTGAVCEVASPNGDDNQYWRDGESDANARLIAAAPDLARALIVSEAARKLAEERLARAAKLLGEADGDLSIYVGAEYPAELRAKYPSVERQWQRDMQLCREIDAFLKEIDNG